MRASDAGRPPGRGSLGGLSTTGHRGSVASAGAVDADHAGHVHVAEPLRTELPVAQLSWLLPAAGLLAALLVQTSGRVSATAEYVRWSDELAMLQASSKAAAANLTVAMQAADSSPAQALIDAGADTFGGHDLRCFLIDAATAIAPVVWLGCVLRLRDLRLYTKLMISCALCALLKGFVASATVMPDIGGFAACEARIGSDAVRFYREVAAGDVGLFTSTFDAFLLELSNLWMIGGLEESRYCADSVFSGPYCFACLFAMGLYDCVRVAAGRFSADQKYATAVGMSGSLLTILVLSNAALLIANSTEYTASILAGALLAALTYGNPAVALAADRWIAWSHQRQTAPQWESVPRASSDLSSTQQSLLEDEEAARGAGLEEGEEPALGGGSFLGQVGIVPCCLPFCALAGLYSLGSRPEAPGGDTGQSMEDMRRSLARLGNGVHEARQRNRQLQQVIEEEIAAAQVQETKAASMLAQRFREQVESQLRDRLRSEGAGPRKA
eukprot:TRINITY_DN22656_c0_g1_i1.p1 TRINITY_DN22656_c0_g1~~TRINITY_DN22656_c0_g1_i1.p1  ORF type:complete len:514 (-),score=97.50 TRINITY_DN22656_c0_g1_i1:50-1546(-)